MQPVEVGTRDVSGKVVAPVTTQEQLDKLNESLIDEINTLAQNNVGNALLKFNVYDPENNMQVQMFSRTIKVNFSNDFLKFFEDIIERGGCKF